MTKKEKQALSWLDYRSSVTGKSEETLRKEMAEKGRLGGSSGRGKKLSEEHKLKLSQAVKGHYAKKQPAPKAGG